MNFLNQALLFGTAAVSIPIIIHLLNRRRFRKVPWAAMRFLKVSVERNQRRMKLEDFILLVLRCALLALLALALARPVVDGLTGVLPGSKVAATVIIDNSGSMRTAAGDGTRLDLAREAATAYVRSLPVGSAVAVATPFRPDEPTTDRDLALQRVAGVSQTDRHADLLSAFEHAVRAVAGQAAAEKEICLITDGQAEEWDAFGTLDEKLREISGGIKLRIVTVGAPITSNLGISRLVPSGALPAVNRPFRIDVDVTNYGATPVAEVPVQLLVDDQAVDEPWVIEEIPAGRSESATLYATLPTAGYHRVTVALNNDLLPVDDRRTMVLRAVDDVRILLVDEKSGGEPRESATFFLAQALAPVPEDAKASYPVKPTVVSVAELAAHNLADYDAVILADVGDLGLPMTDRLTSYVGAGGGLVVFAGENLRTEFYNTLLHTRNHLLPVSFVAAVPEDVEADLTLVPTETNPLALDADMLATARFRRVSQLDMPQEGVRLALRYSDGAPALVESEFGLGKVFVFTSSADLSWNNFAVKPGFVPFVNSLLGAIVQNQNTSLNLRAGEALNHRVEPATAGKEATVYEVGDPKAMGRLTTIADEQGAAVLRFAETDRAGAYQATIAGRPEAVLFAARPSDRESTLAVLGSRQRDRLADTVTLTAWSPGGDGSRFGEGRTGAELWLPLLFLVLGIATVEMILAQWFSRSK